MSIKPGRKAVAEADTREAGIGEQDRYPPPLTGSGDDHFGVCDASDVGRGLQRRQWVTGLRAAADRLDGRRVERGQPTALDALEHFGVCVMGQNPQLAGIARHPRPAQNSVNLSELPVKVPGVIGLGDHPRRVANTATSGP